MKIFLLFLLIASTLFGQLKSLDNRADYIIIYPPAFEEGLTDFITWRESKGYNVKPVSVEAIYEEFTDSSSDSKKIKEFIDYAYNNWKLPRPEYILLVGDVEYIPSIKVKSSIYLDKDSVSVDGMYVTDNLTKQVQLAIGRIPCNTNMELQNCIEKTILFEDSEQDYVNYNKFVVLADTDSSLVNIFENSGDRLVSRISDIDDCIFEFERIDIDSISSLYKTSDEFLETVSNGSLVLHYVGHGNPFVWSRSSYLVVDDFDSLLSNTFPFFFTAVACNQDFDIPDSVSIVENLLLMEDRGTAASITSSGANLLGYGNSLFNSFYKNVLKNINLTIGKALVSTKNEKQNSGFINRFTILGDPALKLPLHVLSDVDNNEITLPNSFVLEQNYPNPFNPTTMIGYQLPVSSFVELKIFDVLGKEVITLVNNEQLSGKYTVQFDASNLSSGIYFYSLSTQGFRQTKKMILIK